MLSALSYTSVILSPMVAIRSVVAGFGFALGCGALAVVGCRHGDPSHEEGLEEASDAACR